MIKSVHGLLLLWILLNLSAEGASQAPAALTTPQLTTDSVVLTTKISKLKPGGQHSVQNFLSVFVGDDLDCCNDKYAIQGRYRLTDGKVIFTPDFPFMLDQAYKIRTMISSFDDDYQSSRLDKDQPNYFYTTFTIVNETESIQARVIKIYPTSGLLAENILRFYVYFSTPMKRQVALEYIKLIDENGKRDLHAFMRFKQELWSPDGKRLTLLFDPGRIKRKVATNIELGPALQEGKRYQLVIDGKWETATGKKLKRSFVKEFLVVESLRTFPDPKKWIVKRPMLNSSDPLSIRFDRIYDHALSKKFIQIRDLKNSIIMGEVSLVDNEKSWIFRPEKNWNVSEIKVIINAELEDIAGNNLQDLLDHTVSEGSRSTNFVSLPVILGQ